MSSRRIFWCNLMQREVSDEIIGYKGVLGEDGETCYWCQNDHGCGWYILTPDAGEPDKLLLFRIEGQDWTGGRKRPLRLSTAAGTLVEVWPNE